MMKMKLQTSYEIKAIPIIKHFVEYSAKYFGANNQEAEDLKLASKAAAEYIVEFNGDNQNQDFEIHCELNEDIFRVSMSYQGVPIDESGFEEADKSSEPSLNQMRFYQINKLTDRYYFENLGAKGWMNFIERKLLSPISQEIEEGAIEQKDKDKEIINHAREELHVERAQPADAFDITKLAYYTYHYSYAKTQFYYPSKLQEEIEKDNVICFVAKNTKGEVVINSSYLRSQNCREIVEAGALMSHPAYRRNRGLIFLIKKQISFCKDEKSGVRIIEANLVTAHTGSQRVTKGANFYPMAIKVSAHDRVDFVEMHDIDIQRESLLYQVWTPFGLDPITLYAPSKHWVFLNSLFQSANLKISLKGSEYFPEQKESEIEVIKNKKFGMATLILHQAGIHWRKDLSENIRQLDAEHYMTYHLKIPAWRELPNAIEQDLSEDRFFFAGVTAHTTEQWMLLYVRLDNQIIDFSKIHTAEENSTHLRDYIESCYKQIKDY
jgi:hypothetical protein